MIDKEKLIKDLEDRFNNNEYYISINSLLTDIRYGRYDAKCIDTHDVDEYYNDDEDVWCK